jgi:hypothetical protein
MILAWIGLALLSASWLFAIGYYTEPDLPLSWLFARFGGTYGNWPDPAVWSLLVVAGTLCLASLKPWRLGPIRSLMGLLLSIPALLVLPWPYGAAPLLLMCGLGLSLVAGLFPGEDRRASRPPRTVLWIGRILGRLATGSILAACILLAQGVLLEAYQSLTACNHELPRPLPELIGGVGRCLGIDLAVSETTLALHSMREIHQLGATWELLLDPASLCLLVGGLVLLAWRCYTQTSGRGAFIGWLGRSLVLVLLFVLWLPVRSGLYMALLLNDALRIPYEADIDSMRLFWDPLLLGAFLLPPVLLAWRFLPRIDGATDRRAPAAGDDPPRPVDTDNASAAEPVLPASTSSARRLAVRWALGCTAAAVAVLMITLAVYWCPSGQRKPGRVLVEEYHPNPEEVWEKTWTPMDTQWYGHRSGYNYYCLYQYLTHFYRMERKLEGPLTADDLDDGDVLIIKVPTRPFSAAEAESIVRFVERGGGLVLIGEHTNFRRSSTFMNPIAARFGFRFRADNVYSMRGKIYDIPYEPPLVPHPIVQHARTLKFATPCSIEAHPCSGRAVVRGMALKNLPADYRALDNYMPQPGDSAEMRYGPFVQLWATRYGKGRVVAFTDSTIFSNFSTFEPDTVELMLGMIEWVKRRPPRRAPWPWLLLGGGVLLAAGLWLARPVSRNWVLLVAAGLGGWSVAVVGVRAMHAAAMPLPAERAEKTDLPDAQRQKIDVVIDRTVCKTPLPEGGTIAGGPDTYGLFERWILRLGYFTSRRDATDSDRDVFGEELVVFLDPNHPVDGAFQKRLVDYVAAGGKVLVVESPLENRLAHASHENDEDPSARPRPSVVNDLLEPFDISIDHDRRASGVLTSRFDWPEVPVADALAVKGGVPIAFVDGTPVAAARRSGKGLIVAVGFGNRFTDDNMGYSDHVEPNETERQVFEVQYRLIRAIVESPPAEFVPPPAEESPSRS